MAYSTAAMVRLALNPGGADGGVDPPSPLSGTAADLTNGQLVDAIAEADSTIDSMISKYYAIPVQAKITGDDTDATTVGDIPHPIDYWSRNIAAYNATLSYRKSLDFTENDPVARRYNATMAALTAVMKGQATLQLPDNTTPNAATGAGAPLNPYVGDFFDTEDFNLRPINSAWPMYPDVPGGFENW